MQTTAFLKTEPVKQPHQKTGPNALSKNEEQRSLKSLMRSRSRNQRQALPWEGMLLLLAGTQTVTVLCILLSLRCMSSADYLLHFSSTLNSPILTLVVGPAQRLFAAHEDILSSSPFFSAIIRSQFLETHHTKRISLPGEIPEVFSSVLEYLYKGDYYPRLLQNKRSNKWELEDAAANAAAGEMADPASMESTVYCQALGQTLLKDTLVYCTAEKYGLDELKRLALRKQGLQSGIQCSSILASARYAYANTPEDDSKLRAHYLALIIRSRNTFKRSGTMQMEMEKGGTMFFDLFVAMCNHMVCIIT